MLPRRASIFDGFRTAIEAVRSGQDPINPVRIDRLRSRGLTYRQIGIQIATEDGRAMSYTSAGVTKAHREWQRGNRDEEGEPMDWKPATNRVKRKISLGTGIGAILFGPRSL